MKPDSGAVFVLDDLQSIDAFIEPQGGAIFPELMAELVDNLMVDKRQQPVTSVDQGDPHAESGKDAGIFAADHTGSNDRQCPRQPIELKDVVAGKNSFAVERDMRIAAGFRAGGD